VNSDLGPSVDSFAATRVKKGSVAVERIAHRQCNTMKGKVSPVVPWSKDIFVVDPAPIFETVERLRKKGGRDIIARCPGEQEANEAATWLLDRLSRLAPELSFETQVSSGGGQYVLALKIS
jgi:hypothetical protein